MAQAVDAVRLAALGEGVTGYGLRVRVSGSRLTAAQRRLAVVGQASKMPNVLFVCSQNRLRSPTAERIFGDDSRFEARSAGVDRDARVVVSADLLQWADLVFVMENRHRNVLRRRFKAACAGRRIICLHIPDEFDFMDPELVQLLKAGVNRFLGSGEKHRKPSL